MKEKILIKSVLEGYHFMDKIIKKLDANVLTKGINSYHTQGTNETLNLVDDLMHLTFRKQKLLTIKRLIEDCVKVLPERVSKVIMLKYIDCFKNADIAKMLGVSSRTVSRILEKGISDVALFFYANGFSYFNLRNYLIDESWLIEIYDNHIKYFGGYSQKHVQCSI